MKSMSNGISSFKFLKKLKRLKSRLMEGEGTVRLYSVILLVLFAVMLLSVRWFFDEGRYGFVEGHPAPRAYLAISPMKYVDEDKTKLLRDRVQNTISGVLVRDSDALNSMTTQFKMLEAGDLEGAMISKDLVTLLNQLPKTKKETALKAVAKIGFNILLKENNADTFSNATPEALWLEIESLDLPMDLNNLIYQLLEDVLRPAVKVDEELTQNLRSDLASSLKPIEQYLKVGDVIVEKGEIITPQLARILLSQGYLQQHFPWKIFTLSFLLILCWPFWIRLPAFASGGQNYDLNEIYIACVVGAYWFAEYISGLLGARGVAIVTLTGWAYLVLPFSLGFQVIFGASIIASILMSAFSTSEIVLVSFMGLTAAMTGRFFFRDVHSRSHLWRQLFIAGLLPVFAGIFARWAISLELTWQVFLISCLAEALWGTVVIAFLPIWENFFDIMSPLRLMELSYPTQPLLKKLQIEAPGTYHHSLMVGTLAETAADRLGMNAYLIRAGAYYHDIGKLRRPHFFVENQMEGENIHDELTPSLSALVIIAHVREGLEIANEYHLPAKLRQFIAEHHGTTCLSYFYRKSNSQGEKLPREQFCYPGPRPSCRETALLMLADSVEAAVRADRKNISGIQDLEKVISGVIDSKVAEGQLDNVDFTLKDLSEIKEALIYALQSVYHGRKVKEIQSSEEEDKKDTTPELTQENLKNEN